MKRSTKLSIMFAIIMCILLVCLLVWKTIRQDRMIGVFVTKEDISLFGNRIYATPIYNKPTDEESGIYEQINKYDFEGIDGFALLTPQMSTDNRSYGPILRDNGITIEGQYYGSIEAVIYVIPGMYHLFYFNPVYQKPDLDVYVVPEAGAKNRVPLNFDINRNPDDPKSPLHSGFIFRVTGAAFRKTDRPVTISIKAMYAPEKIVILQMNEESMLLSRTEYLPGTLPGNIIPEAETSYLVTETYQRDDFGNPFVTYQVNSSKSDRYGNSIATYKVREDGILLRCGTQIMQNEEFQQKYN